MRPVMLSMDVENDIYSPFQCLELDVEKKYSALDHKKHTPRVANLGHSMACEYTAASSFEYKLVISIFLYM